jgi:DNA polymerase-3 subunit epsilon
MRRRGKFALWLAALYAGLLAVPTLVGLTLLPGLPPEDQAALARIAGERAPLLIFVAVLLAFVSAGVVSWLFREYVSAIGALTEKIRVVLGANADLPLASDGAREVAELASAAERLAAERRQLRHEVEARVRDSRARLEEERNRLAALMSELSQGVLVCNAEGRILLYNEQARAVFSLSAGETRQALVGLGRSVFGLIDRDQVAHALERLQQGLERGDELPRARFVTATAAGRLVKVQAAPFLGVEGSLAGLVLTLEDVTGFLDREGQRLSLLHALAAGMRAPVANVRAAAENLVNYADMGAERRTQFVNIVAAESLSLSKSINEALRAHADALKASLALDDMRAADLVSVARVRIEAMLGLPVETDSVEDTAWLRVDSFAFVQALGFLCGKLRDEYGVRSLRLEVRAAPRYAELDLGWSGAIVSSDALGLWEGEPMRIGTEQSPLTLRDVLERHGAEVWLQSSGPAGGRSARFRFLLPLGEPAPAQARIRRATESRPEYYDFDLFRHGEAAQALHERKLSELAYTVFDTETTGLEPSAGDEIISIGAVRIVNGRLLKSEVFERLVNPRRSLNPQSTKVHGIDAAMLQGEPAIEAVLPAFHHFCEDTVLVAHNAAFDMRFLEMKETATGVRFSQPVLDTLLLSVVLHPNLEDHRLEAIAERLGVPVIGRHTALGDALLAGELFLKMLPLLTEQGVVTLGEALEASRKSYYARLRY